MLHWYFSILVFTRTFATQNLTMLFTPPPFIIPKNDTHVAPYIEFRPSKKASMLLGIGALLIGEIIGTPYRRLL